MCVWLVESYYLCWWSYWGVYWMGVRSVGWFDYVGVCGVFLSDVGWFGLGVVNLYIVVINCIRWII